jgi:hypothetical protein
LRNENIGVKLREGKIEVKHRIGSRAKGCLNSNVWGYYDDFIKWSFDVGETDTLLSEILAGEFESWIPVRKKRMLVQLTEEKGKIIAKSISSDVPFGCQVEYSQIQIHTEKWHTFGLEWFGKRYLKLDVETVSEIFGDAKLHMGQSQGYAAFLQNFTYGQRKKLHTFQNYSSS